MMISRRTAPTARDVSRGRRNETLSSGDPEPSCAANGGCRHDQGDPMGRSENADRIRSGYEAFNRADVPALMDLFAEDIVWHFPGTSKLAGEHIGRDATLAVLGAYGAASDGTLQAKLIDIMASDKHVAGVANDTAAAGGKTLDVRSTVVFSMSDGKVSEAWHYIDDLDALDAFLA